MSVEKWIQLDVDQIEPVEVTPFEKARIKKQLLGTSIRSFKWRPLAASAIAAIGVTTVLGFSFPTVAAQIPFMSHVMAYFQDTNTEGYETYSTDIGLSQSSGGIEILVDKAVYDGTNVTIAFAINAEEAGQTIGVTTLQGTSIDGADGLSGSTELMRLGNDQYAGLAIIAPDFERGTPEHVQVNWEPVLLTADSASIEGDWSFEIALERIMGDVQLLNQVVKNDDVAFTLQSLERTPVSTVIEYEQVASTELLENWEFVTPSFRVSDDLGNVYLDEESGSGVASEEGALFTGSSSFGAIDEQATELIIVPLIQASAGSGKGREVMELEPIRVALSK